MFVTKQRFNALQKRYDAARKAHGEVYQSFLKENMAKINAENENVYLRGVLEQVSELLKGRKWRQGLDLIANSLNSVEDKNE